MILLDRDEPTTDLESEMHLRLHSESASETTLVSQTQPNRDAQNRRVPPPLLRFGQDLTAKNLVDYVINSVEFLDWDEIVSHDDGYVAVFELPVEFEDEEEFITVELIFDLPLMDEYGPVEIYGIDLTFEGFELRGASRAEIMGDHTEFPSAYLLSLADNDGKGYAEIDELEYWRRRGA